jgi:hypothetical protein
MTRSRDLAALLTTASDLATDVETAAAISAHNSATTSVHGITDTSALATSTSVSSSISTHATSANGHVLRGNTASRPASPSVGDVYSNTQTGYIEVYTATGWSQLGVIPTSATIGTATDVGTNIAYGSGSVDVTFTPGAGGGLVSSFTATSTSGGYSNFGLSSPIRVSNIPTGTTTTFTVTATNGYGNALATAASNSVTTTSVPQAPTIGTASDTLAGGQITLAFTANATGGKTITNYKYSTDGVNYTAFSPAQTTSPLTISGLTNGQSYSIYLKAVNANGDSSASSASNSITPTQFVATGGSTTTSGGYKYHVFTSNGTFSVSAGSRTVQTVCIAGGGGTSTNIAGGGGAGGLSYNSGWTAGTGNYSIVVGGGGGGAAKGNDTTFTGLTTAVGGGIGAAQGSGPGGNGGSGGGGQGAGSAGQMVPGSGTAGQGNSGGYGFSGASHGGGGGGGAGGVGGNAGSGPGGAGGSGTNSYSTWLSAISSLMTGISGWTTATSTGYIAGGGGGASYQSSGVSGGAGGGGNSGNASNGGGGSTPITNTGGGAGGGFSGNTSGASGLVIVRYAL